MLWFPEYYEEGVENTPARILMTEVMERSVLQKLSGKRFIFWSMTSVLRWREPRNHQISERNGIWQTELADRAHRTGENTVRAVPKEHIEQIASDFIRQKRGEELEWLLHTYPLEPGQKELFTGLVNLADKVKSPEILSMLMEYQRLHFPSKRRSFEL